MGHEHDHHNDCHDHDHHHAPRPVTAFKRASAFVHRHQRPLTVLSTALLCTTALATPALTGLVGAGAVLAASLGVMILASGVVSDGAHTLAERMGLSAGVAGVGLALMESMPEMGVAAMAIMNGARDISMGNIVGSNIAHVLLIIGAVAAIAGIKKSANNAWKFNTAALAGATALFGGQLAAGVMNPYLGVGMISLAGAFLIKNFRNGHLHDHGHEHNHDHHAPKQSSLRDAAWTAAGMGAVLYAAHTAVDSAVVVSNGLSVPEVVTGSLAVGIGTALPELTVNLRLALQGRTEMAVGNILGCGVLNLLAVGGILAATGTAVPESLQPGTALGLLNLGALGLGAGLATATIAANGGGVKRWQGLAALALYAAFVFGSATLQQDAPTALPRIIETRTSLNLT